MHILQNYALRRKSKKYIVKGSQKENILLVQPIQALLHFFFLIHYQLFEWKSIMSCEILGVPVWNVVLLSQVEA